MRALRCCGLILVGLLLSTEAGVAGFWDEGLTNGAVRTEYLASGLSTTFGTTAGNTITLDYCPFAQCQTVFDEANDYSDNGGATASEYWVVIMNNEIWWNASDSNSTGSDEVVGPPDAGLPIGLPSDDQVAGLKVRPWNNSARISLDHRHDNPHKDGQGAIPFMAFGVDRDRGNGGEALLVMDDDPDFLRGVSWNMKLEAAKPGQGVTWAAIQAFSEWGGTKRAFYLTLYSVGVSPEGDPPELVDFETVAPYNSDGLWNWPIQESLYYPGAEFYVVDATWASDTCPGVNISRHPGVGSDQGYFLQVGKVFRCLSALGYWSDPMPSAPELSGFWWIAEITGDNARMQYLVTNPQTVNAYIGPK